MRVQALIVEIADGHAIADAEALTAFCAQLSGAVSAVANGLVGACKVVAVDDAERERLKRGLIDQFNSAYEQAILQRSAAND